MSELATRLVQAAPASILVVDDTRANALAIAAALEPLGRAVDCVGSGREALQALLRGDYAVVLLDVLMPGMDGYETARLIRGRASNHRTPIIFTSAIDRDGPEVRRAYQLGVVDFLFKPIDVDILRAKVQVFIELHDRAVELEKQTAELRRTQEHDRRKDEFLAILAHELRNPLAPLRTSIDLIQRDPSKMSQRMIDLLSRQVGHLAHLVDDLLDVSRFAAGKITLTREPVDLGDVLRDAIATHRPLLDARGHELVVASTGDLVVRGDRVRLVQIVSNILNNAAKYTPNGGRIEVGLRDEGNEAVIEVSDTGRGIPKDLLGRVFDMFVQERAGLDGEGGLGLGLALVRRLTELHGGRVSVSSPGAGRGTRFEVRLPTIDPAERRPGAPSVPVAHAAQRALRTIVIDDNDDLRELVADLLQSFGHHVLTAEDGKSGLTMIREHQPDVALVDIGLPELDGYQVARALRADRAAREVRLVAMTGHGSEADIARALDAGFDAHIVKPATAKTILQVLAADARRR